MRENEMANNGIRVSPAVALEELRRSPDSSTFRQFGDLVVNDGSVVGSLGLNPEDVEGLRRLAIGTEIRRALVGLTRRSAKIFG